MFNESKKEKRTSNTKVKEVVAAGTRKPKAERNMVLQRMNKIQCSWTTWDEEMRLERQA